MDTEEAVERWQELSRRTMQGMARWRAEHPKANMREIEQALDERMTKLRAHVLEDAAQWSAMREWSQGKEVPLCPDCQKALEFRRVKGKRGLQTQGGHSRELEREYGVCPSCGQGFFPPG